MDWYNILKDFGIIALIGGGCVSMIALIFKKINAITKGVQALLRSQLYSEYNRCVHKGCATIDERQNFENCYKRYHNLGKNGVMDDIHEKYLKLPTEPPEEEEEE